jgi:two-component system, OmpR family, response regulator
MKPRILLVDDDENLREVARYALSRGGFSIEEAQNGVEALRIFAQGNVDLIVLDVLMPEMDGMEVCRQIRQSSNVPILFLSSRGEEVDRVLGLELGGDDYLTKPFSTRELVSRVKAILRRTLVVAKTESVIEAGGVRLNGEEHRAWVGEKEVTLTVTEFRLLMVLARRPGRVYTRDELMEQAYPGTHYVSERTVDSHIRRIRQKIREAGADPIQTVHGLGFRMSDQE